MVEANQEQDLNAAGSEERPQRPPAPDYDFTDDMANPATGALGTNNAAGFRRNQVVFFQEQVSNLNKAPFDLNKKKKKNINFLNTKINF